MEKRKQWLALLFGLALLDTGCAALLVTGAAAAGAGTVAYIRGQLTSTEDATLDKTWTATQGAVDGLGFTITSREKDALSAKLVARGVGDKKVEIQLESQTDKVTEIRIRVGVFGDEALSLKILEGIRERL